MPKQQSSGDGAVQMGNVAGNVQNITQVHQHFYAAGAEGGQGSRPVTDQHREVLALMDPLPKKNRNDVLAFMRREFGTGMVVELTQPQTYRLKMYVLKVRETAGVGKVAQ